MEAKISAKIRSLQAVLEGRRFDLAEPKAVEIRNMIIDAKFIYEQIMEEQE